MAGPNQDVQATLRSQEYFRLKKIIQSPGDIFELDTSAKSIYIGPDSDIGEVQLTYYNPDEALSLETAQVSVNGPFVGRIDSSVVTKVSSTGQFAKILVSPTDLVDNNYIDPNSVALRRYNIQAVLDLIVSLRDPPDVPAVRADRTLRFPRVPFERISAGPDDGSTDLIIPIYGRRMVTITVIGVDMTMGVSLVTLQPGVSRAARALGAVYVPGVSPILNYVSRTVVLRASDSAQVSEDMSSTHLSFASDAIGNPGTANTNINNSQIVSRGFADLLLLNLADFQGGWAPGTAFADVFVKVADKET